MDLKKQAVQLNKKVEKLKSVLTDSTALTQVQRTAKENQVVDLQKDLASIQQQLIELKVTKTNKKLHLFPLCSPGSR